MKIYINKKEAVLPSDFSMSYDIENRFFTQSTEGWSLDFDLPLRGCPRNIAIFGAVNRKDVKLSTLSWKCMISHGSFIKQGIAVPISVNEKAITLQFLDGRSEVNYESPLEANLIRDISLPYSSSMTNDKATCLNNAQKDADNSYWELALPWVNNHSGNIQNKIDTSNPTTDPDTGLIYYPFHSDTTDVSCQIYLIELTRRILVALGYSVDLTAWSGSIWKYLLVWNAVPAAWEERNFNIALPKWTALELLQEIEVLTGLDFDIDEKAKTIVAKFAPSVVLTAGTVKLDKVEETFEMEVDEDSDVDFIGAYELKYSDRDDKEWQFESCAENLERMLEEETLDDTPYSMSACDWKIGSRVYGSTIRNTGAEINLLNYFVSEKGKFVVLKLLEARTNQTTGVGFVYYVCQQYLNEFGATSTDEDANFKEIRIVPVRVAESVDTANLGSDDFVFLDPGEYNKEDITEPTTIDEANAYKDKIYRNVEEQEEVVEYFDKLYVSFWKKDMAYRAASNTCLSQNTSQVGVRDRTRTPQRGMRALPTGSNNAWSQVLYNADMSLSLERRTNSNWYLGKIDKTRKYTFKWISKTLPDVKSVFLVNGRRFYCAVIKTQWSINGMSEELEGEFYEIL